MELASNEKQEVVSLKEKVFGNGNALSSIFQFLDVKSFLLFIFSNKKILESWLSTNGTEDLLYLLRKKKILKGTVPIKSLNRFIGAASKSGDAIHAIQVAVYAKKLEDQQIESIKNGIKTWFEKNVSEDEKYNGFVKSLQNAFLKIANSEDHSFKLELLSYIIKKINTDKTKIVDMKYFDDTLELIKDDRFNLGIVSFKLFTKTGLKDIVQDATAEKNYGFVLKLYLYMTFVKVDLDKKIIERDIVEEAEGLFNPVFKDLKNINSVKNDDINIQVNFFDCLRKSIRKLADWEVIKGLDTLDGQKKNVKDNVFYLRFMSFMVKYITNNISYKYKLPLSRIDDDPLNLCLDVFMHVDNKTFENMMDIIYFYDTGVVLRCFIQNYERYNMNARFDALLKIFVKKFVDRFFKLEPKKRNLYSVSKYLRDRIDNYEKMNIYFAEELRNRASKDESKKDILSAILNSMLCRLIDVPTEKFKKQEYLRFLYFGRFQFLTGLFNTVPHVVEDNQIPRPIRMYELSKERAHETVKILRELGLNNSQILKIFTEPSLAWAEDFLDEDFLDKELLAKAEKNIKDGYFTKKTDVLCIDWFSYPEAFGYKNLNEMYGGLIESGTSTSDLWLFFLEAAFQRDYMADILNKQKMKEEAIDLVEFIVKKSDQNKLDLKQFGQKFDLNGKKIDCHNLELAEFVFYALSKVTKVTKEYNNLNALYNIFGCDSLYNLFNRDIYKVREHGYVSMGKLIDHLEPSRTDSNSLSGGGDKYLADFLANDMKCFCLLTEKEISEISDLTGWNFICYTSEQVNAIQLDVFKKGLQDKNFLNVVSEVKDKLTSDKLAAYREFLENQSKNSLNNKNEMNTTDSKSVNGKDKQEPSNH